ncbi:MAG: tetratricopeptide repeat protein [Candidatus Binataceae bacterium]
MASKRHQRAANRERRRTEADANAAAPAESNAPPPAPAETGGAEARPSLSEWLREMLDPIEPALSRIGAGDARVGAAVTLTLAVTAIVFARCLHNGFVFDDDNMIVLNRSIGSWAFAWKSFVNDSWWFRDPLRLPQSGYYRPLQDLWLWLNFHLFGLEPPGWHATAIALHLAVVWLVFWVASRLAANRWTGALAAALFALMPIHAEPVVWASAIPLPLAAAFELGAFACYLKLTAGGESERGQLAWLALSIGLFGGALLSHESAVVFPALVATHAFLIGPHRTHMSYRSHEPAPAMPDRIEDAVAAVRPYAYEAAAYFIIRLAVLGAIAGRQTQNHMTVIETALTIPGAILSYAALLAAPWLAGPAYRLDVVHRIAAPGFWIPLILIAAIAAVGYLLLRDNPRRRLYLFCAAWILIAIAPVLYLPGLFPQALIQDRYLYLASFGFCLIAADLAIDFTRTGAAIRKYAVLIGGAAAAIAYAAILFHVEGFWHDETALFTRCVEITPESAFYRNHLGMALEGRGELKLAREEFEIAAKLDPSSGWNLYDLGLVYLGSGNHRAAERAMAEGLAKFKDPPAGAYAELAIVADAAGDSKGMEAALKRTAALPGGAGLAALTRAQIRFAHGDKTGAEKMLRDLLKRDADNPDMLSTLGAVLASQKRYGEALVEFHRAAAIAPNLRSLHYQTALVLHNLHRDREAHTECQAALEANPGDRGAQALMTELNRSAIPPP